MKRLSIVLATMVMAAAALDPRAVLEPRAKQKPKEEPANGKETSQGCFKSQGVLVDAKDMGVDYEPHRVSQGECHGFAMKKKQPVFSMKAERCFLGEEYPPEDDLVDDSKCGFTCTGFPDDACKCWARGRISTS